jgi:hypothetical protein
MKSPKAPKPLDVSATTAQAATQNTANAWQNAAFNRVNQQDQFGNTLNYAQTGTDAQGNPIFSASQELGATGQQYAGGLSGLAGQYFDQAGQGAPDSQAAFDQAYGYASANLEPRFQRQMDSERTRLANSGFDQSSEGYRNSVNDLALQQNEARNNLVTGLQGQMFTQGLQGRQQQMNELAPGVNASGTFLNGQYANVPQVGVQNVDVAGLAQANQAGQWQNYNAQMQQRNAMLGGIGGLAGTIAGLPMTGGGSLGGNLVGRFI